MAHRSPAQLELQRRIESLIARAAPALDLLLFAGDKVSRVAGRNQIDPEPPRRLDRQGPAATPARLDRPPDRHG